MQVSGQEEPFYTDCVCEWVLSPLSAPGVSAPGFTMLTGGFERLTVNFKAELSLQGHTSISMLVLIIFYSTFCIYYAIIVGLF